MLQDLLCNLEQFDEFHRLVMSRNTKEAVKELMEIFQNMINLELHLWKSMDCVWQNATQQNMGNVPSPFLKQIGFLLFIFQIIYFFFKICTYSCDVFKSRSWDRFDLSVAPRGDNPQDSDSNLAAAGKKKDYILYLKYLS